LILWAFKKQKKSAFDAATLDAINKYMDWEYIPAGGILVGFKTHVLEVTSWVEFRFCSMAMVRNCEDNLTWRLIVVYETHETKRWVFLVNSTW
jgi:hypothetical protein